MNCSNCGMTLSKNARFYASCGADQSGGAQTVQTSENQPLVGYSDTINDPRIASALKKMNKAGIVFTLALAVVAVIGFSVAGALEVGGFELPSAFLGGLALGVLLIVIALFQGAKTKRDKSCDGVVIDKTYKEASYADRQRGYHQTRYFVHIRRNDGSVKNLQSQRSSFIIIR